MDQFMNKWDGMLLFKKLKKKYIREREFAAIKGGEREREGEC